MRRARFVVASFLVLIASVSARAEEPPEGRSCLTLAETRDAVAEHRLTEPLRAMREAAGRTVAQPVGGRLCRWADRFVYEITLLRRDGRVVHVAVDAQSGVVRNER